MKVFDSSLIKTLYIPKSTSHKGENGKVLVIGGSNLFHSASLWSLEIASKIVDMVFYSSIPENNSIVQNAKERFQNGIVVRREDLEGYVAEADCILIGPGMMRDVPVANSHSWAKNILEIPKISDNEGEETFHLTGYLLDKYPSKKWVIDAGALQMMNKEWLKQLTIPAIITPHHKEFWMVFDRDNTVSHESISLEFIEKMAKEYNSVILLKGEKDIVSNGNETVEIIGGNAGMTKGGTGDVLAGLVASLYAKNDAFLSAVCASYINKKAGDELFKRVGYYFNASDLLHEIPIIMKQLTV